MTFQGSKKSRNYYSVKNFWEKEGKNRGDTPFATIRDHYFRNIEIKEIINFFSKKKTHYMLDIGCGNGFSTLFFSKLSKKILGLDYSHKLIQNAKNLLKKNKTKQVLKKYSYQNLQPKSKNIKFAVGNILDLSKYRNNFDGAVCCRVLINLPSKSSQSKAIENLSLSVKKNSYIFITEVVGKYHKLLSKFRTKSGLDPLEVYWHNLYLDEKHFINACKKNNLKLVKKIKYGDYQIASKVIYPKLIKPVEPSFLSDFNKFFSELFINDKNTLKKIINNYYKKKINVEDASHQTTYILKKIK
tara:strand:+ start:1058 stop:1957 length:900 start_codon:yes stop_codon:yes gene_type:complete